MASYIEQIYGRIEDFPIGRVFISNDFLDIANSETVRRTLNQLASEDKIRRIIKGFYYNPKYSELIGEYEAPSMHELAISIARKYNWNIAPYNSTALNLLGLSTQVPTTWKYLSSGRYKNYEVDGGVIEFKKVKPSEIANMSLKTATVIQAIKVIGKKNMTDSIIKKISGSLSKEEKKDLSDEARFVTAWIYEYIKEISQVKNE